MFQLQRGWSLQGWARVCFAPATKVAVGYSWKGNHYMCATPEPGGVDVIALLVRYRVWFPRESHEGEQCSVSKLHVLNTKKNAQRIYWLHLEKVMVHRQNTTFSCQVCKMTTIFRAYTCNSVVFFFFAQLLTSQVVKLWRMQFVLSSCSIAWWIIIFILNRFICFVVS